MNTEKVSVNVNDTMKYTLDKLKESRNAWEIEKDKTDKMLHRLLAECLHLLHLCNGSEVYEQALKSAVDFKYSKKTKLSVIIVKAIFGASKQHYAYAKAMEKAFEKGVGIDGNIGMFDWLQSEGGVNGVIREPKNNNRLEDAEFAEYVLDGYYNFDRMKKSLQPSFTFKSKIICDIVDEKQRWDCFLYAVVERGGDTVKVQPIPIAQDDVMKKMYAIFLAYVAEVGGESYYKEFSNKKKERDNEHKERVAQAKRHMVEKLGKIAEMAVE